MDLSDEAWQAAEGGREEGCADSSSVAPLYTFLCRPLALWTSLLVTNEVPGVLRDFVCVYFVYILFMSLKVTLNVLPADVWSVKSNATLTCLKDLQGDI